MENPQTLELLQEHLTELEPGGRTVLKLPKGGFLFLEHDLPYLMVYRKRKKDKKTLRLARTAASYLILAEHAQEECLDFLDALLQQIAQRFRSFLILEIREGELESTQFVISGPQQKLPSTLNVLATGLGRIEARYGAELSVRVADVRKKKQVDPTSLFDTENLRAKGGTWIGIEVPPVYRDGEGTEFPVYFRTFRNRFAETVQEASFEFIRVQTPSKLASYHTLGRRSIHEEVLKIDKKICAIQNSYSFLLLVAPINIYELRQKYFDEGFKNVGTYHYRLLPVDPDILKRKLYNLDIHEIDDPALAYIYDEKREEIDQELTMLKERGSKNFFYSSIRMYGTVSEELLKEARDILDKVPEDSPDNGLSMMSAEDFKALAEKEFDYFRTMAPGYQCKVHIRKDVNIMMVDQGELYLPADYTMTEMEACALIQHEIGTHALTFYNGAQQPLLQMASGLAGYDALQEGIAVMAEYLAEALGAKRLRTLAGRVVAGDALCNGADFDAMFDLLHSKHGFSDNRAFNITSRMFQGGGFLKDIVYLKGLMELREYMVDGGALEP